MSRFFDPFLNREVSELEQLDPNSAYNRAVQAGYIPQFHDEGQNDAEEKDRLFVQSFVQAATGRRSNEL